MIDFRAHRFQVGSYVGGMVAANGRSIKIDDVGNDPRFDASWARRSKARCECTMAAAIRDHDGTVIAIIQALNKRPAPPPLLLASSPLSSPAAPLASPPTLPLSASPSSVPSLSLASPKAKVAPTHPHTNSTVVASSTIPLVDYKLNVAPLAPPQVFHST
jgi:hypothetical protein